MLPYSRLFDQRTLALMVEHDAIVQRYRTMFALINWQVLPDPVPDPCRPGRRPHPESAYIKALFIKINEGYEYCSQLRTFLIEHPHVRIHFTPTYSSWLNQVELWFSKIERDLLARGIFTSVPDLARKIRRYIRHYNKAAKPIRWSYRNPAHRISSTSVSTVH